MSFAKKILFWADIVGKKVGAVTGAVLLSGYD